MLSLAFMVKLNWIYYFGNITATAYWLRQHISIRVINDIMVMRSAINKFALTFHIGMGPYILPITIKTFVYAKER